MARGEGRLPGGGKVPVGPLLYPDDPPAVSPLFEGVAVLLKTCPLCLSADRVLALGYSMQRILFTCLRCKARYY